MEKKANQLKEFVEGNVAFKKNFFKKHETELIELSRMGQQPKALFIGCADSRVVPNLVTQAKPGDLFVIRNIGNFVPQYSENECFNSTSAGIEYAVTILNVSEIIICGHTQCGAIEHLMSYPCVKAKIDAEELFIHGWYYDISDGSIDYYDPDEGMFKPLSELESRGVK